MSVKEASYDANTLGAESYINAALTSIVRAHVEGVNAGFDLQQRKVDALVAAASAALQYMEGTEIGTVEQELAACNYCIAQLRSALERAK